MGRYFMRKAVLVLPTLFGAAVVVFFALRVLPSDPVAMMLGEAATPEVEARLRAELRLDDPLPTQFALYLLSLAQGDLGQSLRFNTSVARVVLDALPATMELAVASFLFAGIIGLVAGITTATRQYSSYDNAVSVLVLFGVSMPHFWTALLAILVFGLFLGWLPTGGPISVDVGLTRVTGMYLVDALIQGRGDAFVDAAKHLVLPAATLGLGPAAVITRQMRSAMLEVLRNDYVTTARSKGLREAVVVTRHVVRNSLIPVVTLMGLQLGALLSGAIVIETIFARPGIGRLAITAIGVRDYPVVQGVILISVASFVVINFVVDLLYAYLDPRIKYS